MQEEHLLFLPEVPAYRKEMGFHSVKFVAAFPILFGKGMCSLSPVAVECQQIHLTSRTLGDCKELARIKFFCPRLI